MTCNHCATSSAKAAAKRGAPEVEAVWAEHRNHPQYCPTCHGFLRADGGCTRCDNGDASTPDDRYARFRRGLNTGVGSDAKQMPSPVVAAEVVSANVAGTNGSLPVTSRIVPPQSRAPTRPIIGNHVAICSRHNAQRSPDGKCLQCETELQELDESQKAMRWHTASRRILHGVSVFNGSVGGMVIGGPLGAAIGAGIGYAVGKAVTWHMQTLENSKNRFYTEERNRIMQGQPTPAGVDELTYFKWWPW